MIGVGSIAVTVLRSRPSESCVTIVAPAAIAAYERGVVVLRGLHEELARAEERIRVLTAVADDGQPITEPFRDVEDGPAADVTGVGNADKVGRRPASRASAQRKAARLPTLPGMDDSPAEA